MARSAALLLAALPFINAEIPSIDGFTLTWGDDFIGTAGGLPSTANWQVDTGTSYPGGPANWGTGEIQTYTSNVDNIRLSGDGAVQITAIKDESGGWTSSRIETLRGDFMAEEGGVMRIQASLSLPDVGEQGIGYWPAFWTLGAAYREDLWTWPAVGEFDMAENVNARNGVWGVLHCGVNPGGPCKETDGLVGYLDGGDPPLQGSFHTYTFEVDRSVTPDAVRWYLDGNVYWEVTADVMDTATWEAAVHVPHFVLMNLAIGGAFPDKEFGSVTPLADTVSGGMLQAEYIAVYNS